MSELTDFGGWKVGAADFLAAVLQTTAQPIWVVDPDGLIRFANPAAIAALGYDNADELFGRPSHETIHHTHPDGTPYPAAECPMLLPRTTGETVSRELDWFFRRDGSMFPVAYVSAPIQLAEGRGAVVAFSDIEPRMRAAEALEARDAVLASEQASLRRLATLIAQGADSADVFAAIAREVAHVLKLPFVEMSRYEPDGTATVIGAWSDRPHPFRVGTRWPLDAPTISTLVRRTGRPARVEDYAQVPGAIADAARGTELRCGAGAPILVDGRTWGVMAAGATDPALLPPGTEDRLAEFTELVATAIAGGNAREQLGALAAEQAALRRVATLVAGGAAPEDVFAAVAAEVGHLAGAHMVLVSRDEGDGTATVVGAWGDHPLRTGARWSLEGPSISKTALESATSARTEDPPDGPGGIADVARALGVHSRVAAPIVVDGAVWGVIAAGAAGRRSLPADIEPRLAEFTELVATAISNTQAREDLRVLAEEQAALRRVATIAATGASPAVVFRAVVDEVKEVLELPVVALTRYEPDRMVLMMAAAGDHPFTEGTLWPLDGLPVASMVLERGEASYLEEYVTEDPTVGPAIRKGRVRSGLAVPIFVDNEVWGTISTASTDRPLPADAAQRLTGFTELVAGVVLNAQAREELAPLAGEQAALRRVATLVAQGAPPAEVFSAVAAEVSSVLDLPLVEMCRYEPDGTATVIGAIGDHPFQTGTNWTLDGPSLTARVKRTGRPARVDDYADVPGSIGDAARANDVHSGVGAPVVVDGEVWGVVSAGSGARVSLRPDAEERLSQFTELVATAISNAQARGDLERLADEQAALRRIATLVAEGAEPNVVFDAVAEETGRLLGATTVNLCHFTPDGINVTISGWSLRGVHVPAGTRLRIDGDSINAIVRRTARPGRCDSYDDVEGELAARLRSLGIRSEVGAPVIVERVVWGVLIAGTDEPEPLPPGTEHRLAEFAELVATAVANATARTELVASRARIVEAADEQRRRVVRDLHDGAQQRLVHALMTLQVAVAHGDASPEVHSALGDTRAAIDELRELAHGLHPAVLTHHGLAAAVEGLADRSPFPVTVAIDEQRYPASIESAAYFVTAEALTNAAKYARATAVTVSAIREGDRLVLVVADDGVGGAAPHPGRGLAGLEDRVAALSGRLVLDSAPGAGTRVRAEIPLD